MLCMQGVHASLLQEELWCLSAGRCLREGGTCTEILILGSIHDCEKSGHLKSNVAYFKEESNFCTNFLRPVFQTLTNRYRSLCVTKQISFFNIGRHLPFLEVTIFTFQNFLMMMMMMMMMIMMLIFEMNKTQKTRLSRCASFRAY